MAGRKSHPEDQRFTARRSLNVVPVEGGWQVRENGSPRRLRPHENKAQAVAAAHDELRISGGELHVQGRDGRAHHSMTLGRRAIAKISSVEGVSLGGDIARDLEAFDREELSFDERRARIAAKYAGTVPRR